jgi:hypothetical protein
MASGVASHPRNTHANERHIYLHLCDTLVCTCAACSSRSSPHLTGCTPLKGLPKLKVAPCSKQQYRRVKYSHNPLMQVPRLLSERVSAPMPMAESVTKQEPGSWRSAPAAAELGRKFSTHLARPNLLHLMNPSCTHRHTCQAHQQPSAALNMSSCPLSSSDGLHLAGVQRALTAVSTYVAVQASCSLAAACLYTARVSRTLISWTWGFWGVDVL